MFEIREAYIGKLKCAVNSYREKYNDWRAEYYNKIGVVAIYEDEIQKRGKYIIRFMPIKDNGELDEAEGCLRTSPGDLFLDYVADKICLVTPNSIYQFEDVVFKKQYEKSI